VGMTGSEPGDVTRRLLNLALSFGQSATTAYVATTGADPITNSDPAYTTLMVPAGYAFSIWGPIYAATAAYGVYQARPALAEDPLLRRVGRWTAPAFLGTSVWLLAAQRRWVWTTVVVFAGMLVSLWRALREIQVHEAEHGALTPAQRWLVRAPLSVFAGWSSAAVLANVSIALKVSGLLPSVGVERAAVSGLTLTAGAVGATATRALRGNAWYAATVLWALVALVVANVGRREPGPAAAAGVSAIAVVAALLGSRGAPRGREATGAGR
ncbi:MAG TPA: hypothetical protein VFX49_21400, partial [Chloroflexota bacterium]|nr:hypothetical protein [Chloroflexota bacterium]